MTRFTAILSVSEQDRIMTTKFCHDHKRIWVVPNGVDIDYFKRNPIIQTEESSPKILFCASYDVVMNVDAVLWFANKVFNLIKREIPNIEFWVVGRNPPPQVLGLSQIPGIHVTGTVTDVREYFRKASVFIVPLKIGGGTKLKTIEAMAMSLPVVSTTIGSQGLSVESGKNLFIADSADDFKIKILLLLKNKEKAMEVGAAGRRLVEEKYSWQTIFKDVGKRLENIRNNNQNIISN